MKSILIATLLVGVVTLAACGGDKKAEKPAEKPAATAERAEPTKAPKATATAAEEEQSDGDINVGDGAGAVSSVFSSLFQTGTGGGSSLGGLGSGDESLKAYLPDAGDFPDGYTSIGSFTFSAPSGSSDLGAMDMAMTMAVRGNLDTFAGGDPSDIDLSSIEMLMAAVIKPEDLQALGSALGDLEGLSAEDIQDEMDAAFGQMEGFTLERFELLDASDLGDGGFGMEMTVDMSGLNDLIGAFAGDGEDVPDFSSMTMRMYMFGRGDYMGAVIRFAFTDSLPDDGTETDLAGIIDLKLADAP